MPPGSCEGIQSPATVFTTSLLNRAVPSKQVALISRVSAQTTIWPNMIVTHTHTHTHACTHTQPFEALWILSRTTRVSW